MSDDRVIDLVRQVAAAYRDECKTREAEIEAARARIAELEAALASLRPTARRAS